MFKAIAEKPQSEKKTLADLNLVTQADVVYNHSLLKQYALNNVFAITSTPLFLEIIESKGIVCQEFRKETAPSEYHLFDQGQHSNLEMIYRFLAHDVFDVLDPVWSKFKARFNELFFEGNYDLGDESLSLAQQNEVTVLRTIKYVRNGSLIDVLLRQGTRWVKLNNLDSLEYSAINPRIKDHDFRSGKINSSDDFIKLVAAIALSDVFHMPYALLKVKETSYDFSKREVDYFSNVLSFFLMRMTFSYDKYLLKPTLNKEFVSPYHRYMRSQKIKWVISNFFDQEYCALFFKLSQFQYLTVAGYNDFVQVHSPYMPQVRMWDNDHKNKLLYLLNMDKQEISAKTLSENSLAFSNILYKHNPEHRAPFFDKRGYNGFLKHANKTLIFTIFKNLQYTNKDNAQYLFMVWSNWFGYTRFTKLNTHVANTVIHSLQWLSGKDWDFNGEKFKNHLKKSAIMLDLLYEHLHGIWQKHKKLRGYVEEARNPVTIELYDFVQYTNDDLELVNIDKISNKATLKSLYRQCHEWHLAIRLGGYSRNHEDYAHLIPCSLVIGQSKFTLIHNDYDLYNEGAEMHHCINDYHRKVKQGSYLAFKVESGEVRATLGVVRNSMLSEDGINLGQYNLEQKQYIFDQCFSYCNKEVNDHIKKDAYALINMLNEGTLIIEDRSKLPDLSNTEYADTDDMEAPF